MEIVYHIGAHATDQDRLQKSLLKNKGLMAEQGVVIVEPEIFKGDLRHAVATAFDAEPSPADRDRLIETLQDGTPGDRIVMSHSGFICMSARIFENGHFYPVATRRLTALDRLFPDDEIEIHFSIRNPATFIPAILNTLADEKRATILEQLDPFSVRWSELIMQMRETLPHAVFNVWCNEDTPLIWSQILREMCGVDPTVRINGGFDLLGELMTQEGLHRFQSYLKTHPPATEVQKRRIIAAFLDKFAIEDALEEELDVPGWTDETVDFLTEAYEEDVYAIERLHGVNFIAP